VTRRPRGFTLLEVLVAVAMLGVGLVSLLGLHVRNLALLERDRNITDATLLARTLMSEVEVQPFPDLGVESGDFEDRYPGEFPDYRWEREVVPAPLPFPDVREIRVRVFRGDGGTESGDDVTLDYFLRRR
jgi:general secretion pathway protein I